MSGKRAQDFSRHCEEQRDAAIQSAPLDCFAPLAMTKNGKPMSATAGTAGVSGLLTARDRPPDRRQVLWRIPMQRERRPRPSAAFPPNLLWVESWHENWLALPRRACVPRENPDSPLDLSR